MTERYTHGHAEPVLRSHGWRTAENSAGYLLDALAPGLSVLDVGCGPGTITADLARLVAPGPVVGLDPAPDAVAAAADRHQADNLRFVPGDVYELAAADDSYDVVHAHQVLQHLGDPVRALTEMRRVTRPGGVVAARDADYLAMSWWPASPGLDRWLAVYRELARANGGEPDAARHLRRWCEAAGFDEVRWSASTWCFATPADRSWWGTTWAERITTSSLATQAVELGIATPADLDRCAAAWREWAGHDGACFIVPHGEVIGRA